MFTGTAQLQNTSRCPFSCVVPGGLPQGKRENNSLSNLHCEPKGDRRATVSFCSRGGDFKPVDK